MLAAPLMNERRSVWGRLSSLLYWTSLLLLSFSFAVLVLTPKLLHRMRLEETSRQQQERRRELEEELRQLVMLRDKLADDPGFVRQWAGWANLHPDDSQWQIGLPESLRYQPRLKFSSDKGSVRQVSLPWWQPFIKHLATREGWQARWQLATFLLMLLSFACLHENAFEGQLAGQFRSLFTSLIGRYRRNSAEPTQFSKGNRCEQELHPPGLHLTGDEIAYSEAQQAEASVKVEPYASQDKTAGTERLRQTQAGDSSESPSPCSPVRRDIR